MLLVVSELNCAFQPSLEKTVRTQRKYGSTAVVNDLYNVNSKCRNKEDAGKIRESRRTSNFGTDDAATDSSTHRRCLLIIHLRFQSMSSPTHNLHSSNEMRDLRAIQRSLQAFASSSQTIEILRTVPPAPPKHSSSPKTLYILDSSFNPPTRAHLRICTSALLHDRSKAESKRLLLLLATQNADKAPKPVAFEQRLVMMSIFAEEMVKEMAAESGREGVVVEVGVTKKARFVDKARVIEECGDYSSIDDEGWRKPIEQVHLTGFDTLVRFLDIKYYPPDHTLAPLEGLFEKHRVRVTRRTGDGWGGRDEQDEYIWKLQNGQMEDKGGKRQWAERIELVEGRKEGEEIVSSTKVREVSKKRDEVELMKLVTEGVGRWIFDEKLYVDGG